LVVVSHTDFLERTTERLVAVEREDGGGRSRRVAGWVARMHHGDLRRPVTAAALDAPGLRWDDRPSSE